MMYKQRSAGGQDIATNWTTPSNAYPSNRAPGYKLVQGAEKVKSWRHTDVNEDCLTAVLAILLPRGSRVASDSLHILIGNKLRSHSRTNYIAQVRIYSDSRQAPYLFHWLVVKNEDICVYVVDPSPKGGTIARAYMNARQRLSNSPPK